MVNEKLDKINRTNQMPIPALAEATEYVDAGPLTIGVEFRFLTGELVVQDYIRQGLDPAKAPKPENVPQRGVSPCMSMPEMRAISSSTCGLIASTRTPTTTTSRRRRSARSSAPSIEWPTATHSSGRWIR